MKVSVIIVNWNGLHLLEPCFQALRLQRVQAHEVIVVDNASTDGSRVWLEAQGWPLLKTVFLDRNTGFSGGNNAALAHVTGDVLALLNNDTEVDPGWIETALPHFDDETVGMVACKSLRYGEPPVIDKAGHLIFPDGLNRGRGTGRPDGSAFDVACEVLWPDGGGGFWRRSMIEEIGFFDDDFFLYGEDADLGLRARWAGYGCVYEPRSLLRHRHSASLGKNAPRKAFFVERNRMYVLIKNFPPLWVWCSPFYTLLRWVMNVVAVVRGRGAAGDFGKSHPAWLLAWQLVRAVAAGVAGAPRMAGKRKRRVRRLSNREFSALLRRHQISVFEITQMD